MKVFDMVYAAIDGMQLKHWNAYFKIIGPTFRVLNAAKKNGWLREGRNVSIRAGVFRSFGVGERGADVRLCARWVAWETYRYDDG